jgi:hypothetical protein
MADFSKLKRRTLGAPPSLEDASGNLEQPELAPAAAESRQPAPPLPTMPPADESRADPFARARRDGRSLRRSNRIVQFATRVTPDFDRRIRDIAEREGLLIVEVLERALNLYESKQPSDSKNEAR